MIAHVLVHNPAPECLQATEWTLKALPGRACLGFVRGADGAVIVDAEGWVQLETENLGFLIAAVQQGYVKAVRT